MSDRIQTIGVRIDIESKSGADIKKAGTYRYVEDPDFEVLLLAYSPIRKHPGGALKIGRPRLLDLDDKQACYKFGALLNNTSFQKHAFNANFERVALSKHFSYPDGTYFDPEHWFCSAINANVNGVFGTLDEVARAVRAPIGKDTEGRRLIKLFCVPDTRKGGRFHERGKCWCEMDHTKDFERFGAYCKQDVLTEAVVARSFPLMPPDLQAEYEADQRINDRGVRHFRTLSEQAIAQVKVQKDRVFAELQRTTGIKNPNSGPQFQAWLNDEAQDYPMTSLDKTHRAYALADPGCPAHVKAALELKAEMSLSSVTKHQAALNTRSKFDGRIRGSLRFYGAHTGREAGRGIQPQNLPRYEAPTADRHRLLRGQAGTDAPLIAKGTVRASLVPARDHVFIVPDYNAIEARCLGWQTGEKWVEEEFRGEGKIYEATAAQMFGVNKARLVAALKVCDKCGKCKACGIRDKGKVSNLALGYAGGAGALVTMGAEAAGIDIGNYKELNALWKSLGAPGKFHEWEKEMHDYPELIRLRNLYRESSPETVRFWKLCARAWDIAATTGKGARFGNNGILTMLRDGKHNRLVLPSGRSIWYRFARAHVDVNNPDRIDRRTFIGKSMGVGHVRTDTHGGKLTENITQAVARDVLFDLIMKIEAMTAQGWPGRIVLHVHDEVVIEAPKQHADQVLADTLGLMAVPPDWAPGLVVKGAGNIMERYGK